MARAASSTLASIERAAERMTARRIEVRASAYRRSSDLSRLRAPGHVQRGDGPVVERWLMAALRAERAKALAGHWSYDVNRHVLLRAALANEQARESSRS